MATSKYYILSPVYGTGKSYKLYSDTVYRTIDIAKKLGLFNSANTFLVAADPKGKTELSKNLIITTGTSLGKASKNAKLDVYRSFTIGTFNYATDGKISGIVTGSLFVYSDGSFEGKIYKNSISLESYLNQQTLDPIRKSEGTSIQSLDAFNKFLPVGWQKDPFRTNLISELNKVDLVTSSKSIRTFLRGTNQADLITGTIGDDAILGRGGADRLTGGKGKDRFVYNTLNDSRPGSRNRDTITDFNGREGDQIDLQKIDGNPKVKGNQKLKFIGGNAFSRKAGEVRFAGGILQVDNNLDRKSDLEIALTGVTSFRQNFLVL
jgi:Ca2+-binding RTX toxin-like protein